MSDAEPGKEVFHEIAGYYEKLIAQHGHDPRACDYGHPVSQQIKFRTLSLVAPLSGKRILDVGCGFADFADYLGREFGAVRYTGVDITPGMIAEAKALHPNLDLRVGNILDEDVKGEFDVVFANGIFYLLGAEAPTLMRSMVGKMFGMARAAVAFNSLSAWAADKEAGEFYADPLETLAFCRALTPWVVLRHDYHHRDFTIYMYREKQA